MSEDRKPLGNQELEMRRTLSNALAFVRGQETLKSLGALTLVELIDEQIVMLDDREGETSVQGLLQRIETLENTLDGTIEAAKIFVPAPPESSVPLPPMPMPDLDF